MTEPGKDNKGVANLKEALARLTKSEIRDVLARVDDFLSEQGIEAYLVGGLVRDVLLGRETADIDLAVLANALDVAEKVAVGFGGRYVLLDEQNRVGRVVLGEWTLDFSTIEDGIEQDLSRRDFTINAMAIELHQLLTVPADTRLIDPFAGRNDLKRGVIRAVKENVFAADAARLLRAVRIAAELDFKIARTTEKLIHRDAHLIAAVAGERVREELLRVLAVPGSLTLSYLDRLRLLTVIFPELADTKGVEQPKEHFWNVFEHSVKTAEAVDFLLRLGKWEYDGENVLAPVPWTATLELYFAEEISRGSSRRELLKLAGLLHDIAKPQTKAIEDGRIRFLGHEKDGASVAAGILERLRFSTRETKLVETEIRYHMRPGQMSQDGELPTPRAIYRYFRDTGEAGVDILFLNLADHLAARGPTLDLTHWRENVRMVEYVLDRRAEQSRQVGTPKLVDGNDLINVFSLSPGPEIGRILEAVKEAQATGEITNRDQALNLVKTMINHNESLI